MEPHSWPVGELRERFRAAARSCAMWTPYRFVLLAAAGGAAAVCPCETSHAGVLPVVISAREAIVIEARAIRAYGQRRRKARRSREKETSTAEETRKDGIALPKRNPRRLHAELEADRAKNAQAKNEIAKAAPPAAAPAAPPAPATWNSEEVIEARERCLVSLSQIVVEIDPAPPMRAGQCGSASPVMLRSLGKGAERVTVRPAATLNCEMVQAIHDWLEKTVQPTAREILGEDIVRLESVAGYQCRTRAGTTRLSEHALANAIDILGFTTRSGYTVSVLDGWGPTQRDAAPPVAAPAPAASEKKPDQVEPPLPLPHPKRVVNLKPITARAALTTPSRAAPPRAPSIPTEQFLKRVHERSCETFKTVLGPEANEDHRNHFHFDLAQRTRGAHYCR